MNNYNTLLNIQNLSVEFRTDDGVVRATNDMSLQIEHGKTLGLVGETGVRETTTALSILRLTPDPPGVITGGSIVLDGEDILATGKYQLEKTRSSLVSMILQDPMINLDPMLPVGEQAAEVYILHGRINKQGAAKKAGEILELVGAPASRGHGHPHRFSGRTKQRVVIAIAPACNPKPLTADEPITVLDMITQAQVLKLTKELKSEYSISMLIITYDLDIVAKVCNEASVMYTGRVVERGTLGDIYERTTHSYIEGLFRSIPNIGAPAYRLIPVPGLIPDPTDLPPGCPFAPRYSCAVEECSKVLLTVAQLSDTHSVLRILCQKEK